MFFYLEDIHLLGPFPSDLPNNFRNLLTEISIPISYVFHARSGATEEDITFDASPFGLKIACFYLSAHSELWINLKHLNLRPEYYNRSGLTDVNNIEFDPDLRTLQISSVSIQWLAVLADPKHITLSGSD